jgi:hypothetical protein
MKKVSSVFLLFFFLFLQAEQYHISIRYLAFSVVNVNIIHEDNRITIKANSTGLAKLAANMENFYQIEYQSKFMPVSYRKNIEQSDFTEKKTTYFFHQQEIAKVNNDLTNLIQEYPIHPEARDFFSALFYLRTQVNEKENGSLYLDANQIRWRADWTKEAEEKVKTFSGTKICSKIKLSFERIDNRKKERSDMLTNNLVTEKNDLYFWFTKEDNLPVKAVFAMKPFPVVWILNQYEK